MNIIAYLLAISGALATTAVIFFVWLAKQRTHEHSDRLTFLPLEEGTTTTSQKVRHED